MRLILDGPCDPYENMARDLALFEGFLSGDSPTTWRCYTWNTTAATYGRNQEKPEGLENIPVIKRETGGGVVPHGSDLTYSVVRERRRGNENYRDIVELLKNALRELGINCGVWEGKDTGVFGVCFASLAAFDIHVGGIKIAGCAQRRKQGGILHHGSITSVAPDPLFVNSGYYNPVTATSLTKETERSIDWPELSGILVGISRDYFGGSGLVKGEYTEYELERACELKGKLEK